jgi:hypothetical protein
LARSSSAAFHNCCSMSVTRVAIFFNCPCLWFIYRNRRLINPQRHAKSRCTCSGPSGHPSYSVLDYRRLAAAPGRILAPPKRGAFLYLDTFHSNRQPRQRQKNHDQFPTTPYPPATPHHFATSNPSASSRNPNPPQVEFPNSTTQQQTSHCDRNQDKPVRTGACAAIS